MTYRVVNTERAKRELVAAYDWLWERDPTYAEKWLDGFEEKLASLADNPEQHGFAPEDGRFVVRLRQMLYGKRRSHRAVFFIRDDLVVVVSIRHAAQEPLAEID